jgi:hypothetical protein
MFLAAQAHVYRIVILIGAMWDMDYAWLAINRHAAVFIFA